MKMPLFYSYVYVIRLITKRNIFFNEIIKKIIFYIIISFAEPLLEL